MAYHAWQVDEHRIEDAVRAVDKNSSGLLKFDEFCAFLVQAELAILASSWVAILGSSCWQSLPY